jgi:hypothetical protein
MVQIFLGSIFDSMQGDAGDGSVARHITAPQTPIRQQKQEEIERKRTSDFR